MSPPSKLCRLCIKTNDDSKRLYDADGKANVLHDMIVEYFHPKIVNMEKAKHLTGICFQCFRQIRSFHSFQFSVMLAQAKLVEKDKDIKSATGKKEQNQTPPGKTPKLIKAVKVEKKIVDVPENESKTRDFAKHTSLVEDRPTGHSTPTFIIKECVTLPNLEATDKDSKPVLSAKQSGDFHNTDDEGDEDENEDEAETSADNKTYNIHLPKLEIMDADTDTAFSSDDDVPLGEVIPDVNKSQSSFGDVSQKIDNPNMLSDNTSKRVETFEQLLAKWMPNIQCVKCPKTFKTLPKLRRHFQSMHPNDGFYVLCCARKFAQQYLFRGHLMLHGDPDAFKCTICGKRLSTNHSLIAHKLRMHPEKLNFTCHVCGKGYMTRSTMATHLREAHKCDPENTYLIQNLPDGSPTFLCLVCGQSKKSLESYKSHNAMRHGTSGAKFVCGHCKRAFKLSREYREHMAGHKNKRLYRCAYCPREYRTLSTIIFHRKKAHPFESAKNYYTLINDKGGSDDSVALDSDYSEAMEPSTSNAKSNCALSANWAPTLEEDCEDDSKSNCAFSANWVRTVEEDCEEDSSNLSNSVGADQEARPKVKAEVIKPDIDIEQNYLTSVSEHVDEKCGQDSVFFTITQAEDDCEEDSTRSHQHVNQAMKIVTVKSTVKAEVIKPDCELNFLTPMTVAEENLATTMVDENCGQGSVYFTIIHAKDQLSDEVKKKKEKFKKENLKTGCKNSSEDDGITSTSHWEQKSPTSEYDNSPQDGVNNDPLKLEDSKKQISLPPLELMDVNRDSDTSDTEDDIPLAIRLAARRKSDKKLRISKTLHQFACKPCRKEFSSKMALEAHKIHFHTTVSRCKPEVDRLLYSCPKWK